MEQWADMFPDGLVLADENGIVTWTNQAAREHLGLTGDGTGRLLRDVVALRSLDGRDWYDVCQPYSGLETRIGLTESSWIASTGHEVLVTAKLSRERAGPVTRVGVVLRDGRSRARLDRERSDLVATLAHELRSPLTGVRGFVNTLIQRWDALADVQRRMMLETVKHDAERLGRLITELLDVARIDTGRLPLYPRPVHLVEVVDRIVESCSVGTSREIRVVHEVDLPQVMADRDKLTQVLTNLVDNGIRHGEGAVTVTVSSLAKDPKFLRITVDDEGDGIPEEMRRRVFTKFWQHGDRGGSGLGMYIVNGLVQAHGAILMIDDAPNGGARIEIRWPIVEQD